MTLSREIIIRQVKMLALFLGASILQSYFMCGRCNELSSYLRVIAFTFLMWVFLWQGNDKLAHFISTKISWIKFPARRLAVGVLATTAYTLSVVFGLIFIFENFLAFNFGSSYQFTSTVTIVGTLFISLFLHSR